MPDMQATIITGHLQNVSIQAVNADLINEKVFPLLDMPTDRAKIMVYNRGDQFRSGRKTRARGTEAPTRDYKVDFITPTTDQYAEKHKITDEDLRDAGLDSMLSPPINLQQEAIERNVRLLDLGREVAVASAIFAATWADGNAGGEDAAGLWAPPGATNTFLTDVYAGIKELVKNGVPVTGIHLAMDYNTFQLLKRVDEIRDQLKYTSNQSLTAPTLAALLGIDEVIVSRGITSSAKEKKDGTDFTSTMIWEKNAGKGSAFLYHCPGTPGLKTLCAGVQPRQKCVNGAYRFTKQYREEKLGAWFLETQEETGIKVVADYAGYLWNDTIVT